MPKRVGVLLELCGPDERPNVGTGQAGTPIVNPPDVAGDVGALSLGGLFHCGAHV
jgi:hypothetical protein